MVYDVYLGGISKHKPLSQALFLGPDGVALRASPVHRVLFCGGFLEASRRRWTPLAGEAPARRGQVRGTELKRAQEGSMSCHGQLHIHGECLKAEAISGFLGLFCPLWSLVWSPLSRSEQPQTCSLE